MGVQVKEIGVYKKGESPLKVDFGGTLEKKDAEKKKPLILKVLAPIAKIFFSEKRRRRASAMRILRKRGLSRYKASTFGLKVRAKGSGWPLAIAQSLGILSKETALKLVSLSLKFALVYPIILLRKFV